MWYSPCYRIHERERRNKPEHGTKLKKSLEIRLDIHQDSPCFYLSGQEPEGHIHDMFQFLFSQAALYIITIVRFTWGMTLLASSSSSSKGESLYCINIRISCWSTSPCLTRTKVQRDMSCSSKVQRDIFHTTFKEADRPCFLCFFLAHHHPTHVVIPCQQICLIYSSGREKMRMCGKN